MEQLPCRTVDLAGEPARRRTRGVRDPQGRTPGLPEPVGHELDSLVRRRQGGRRTTARDGQGQCTNVSIWSSFDGRLTCPSRLAAVQPERVLASACVPAPASRRPAEIRRPLRRTINSRPPFSFLRSRSSVPLCFLARCCLSSLARSGHAASPPLRSSPLPSFMLLTLSIS